MIIELNFQKEKSLTAYVSISKMLLEGTCEKEILFQEIFDGLPKKEILMAYLTRSQIPLTKTTKNGNYQKWKLSKIKIIR